MGEWLSVLEVAVNHADEQVSNMSTWTYIKISSGS